MRLTLISILFTCVTARAVTVECIVQEDVYTFVSPNNGSGPLWSHGCTSIVRNGDDVIVSQMETGENVPPLSNTRWRLLKRTPAGWSLIDEADGYRQREPASLATTQPGLIFLNVNDSTHSQDTEYGPTQPHLLKYDLRQPVADLVALLPDWDGEPHFADHSYRGYAADAERNELFMLNIDTQTGIQHACLMTASGETLARGAIAFPIRACYPEAQLVDRAAHVFAVGDIVEPVEEWRTYKKEKTGQDWDYVFRILYYTYSPDLTKESFRTPIEIANVDATAGHLWNLDMYASQSGDVYLMYSACEVASPLMRDKFFPEKSVAASLYLAVVRDGKVVRRETLINGARRKPFGDARFHVAADGRLYALMFVSQGGAKNVLVPIAPEIGEPIPIEIPKPVGAFSTASPLAGCAPSNTIDVLAQRGNTMVYTQLLIKE